MNCPPLSPTEIRQVLKRSVSRHVAAGLDHEAAVAATARECGASEYKVAALVSVERPPSGLALGAK